MKYDFEKLRLHRKYDSKARTPKDRPSLGAKVTAKQHMRRVHERDATSREWSTWIPSTGPNKHINGVYVGYRVEQSGYREYLGYEGGAAFIQTGTVSVALIVTAENKNPVLVDWEGLE